MGTFSDKFGLEYLRRAGAQDKVVEPDRLPGMDEALISWGRRIVEVLSAAPQQQDKVFNILDKLDVRIDVLLPVINYLISGGYLTKVEEDKKGNDLLKMTERGQKLLQ